jgi:hypothetical protein
LFHTAEATSYYVDSQSLAPDELGTLLFPWTSIDQAASYPLLPGDIVYIKAGNYGSESVRFFSSGIAGAPITFQGYLLTPGDEPVASEPRFTLHTDEMPTLNGMNPSTGIALDLNGQSYIQIKNIQIQNYRLGIRNMRSPVVTSTGIHLENIVGRTFGIQDNLSYSGWGVLLDDQYNSMFNCQIIDAGAEGIGIYGDYNTVENCLVANYNDENATDYFILTWGDYNRIENCSIHRAMNISSHSGHGMGAKNGSFNEFIDCVSVNTNKGFYVSGPECQGNLFKHCVAQNAVGLVVREGAHDNEFNGCVITDTEVAVRFVDSAEFGVQADGGGRDNLFVNCLFQRNNTVIDIIDDQAQNPVRWNTFSHCIMYDSQSLFNVASAADGNELINCVILNSARFKKNSTDQDLATIGFSASNCLLWENNYPAPTGDVILTIPPEFKDSNVADFRPLAHSPLIESGYTIFTPIPDFIGTERPLDADNDGSADADIGIYEYTDELLEADTSATQILIGLIGPFNLADSLAQFYIPLISSTQSNENEFIVLPHEVNSGEVVQISLFSNHGLCPRKILVSDQMGRGIWESDNCLATITLTGLKTGVYNLTIQSDMGVETHRFIAH